MKKQNLVGRAFGRVTSSKKAIDTLLSKGFKKTHENGKSTTMIKTLSNE